MIINIKAPNGTLLAEVDSATIFSNRLKATYHACPVCGQELAAGRDDGGWYMVGTAGCLTCHGLYQLPSVAELADMMKKAEQT